MTRNTLFVLALLLTACGSATSSDAEAPTPTSEPENTSDSSSDPDTDPTNAGPDEGTQDDDPSPVSLSKMNPVADSNSFIAVYPEGTGTLEQTWNAGFCCGSAQLTGVDDVGFTAAVLDELEANATTDTISASEHAWEFFSAHSM